MRTNWLSKFLKPKTLQIKNDEEQEILNLLDFLWKKIDVPANAIHLKTKINSYKELDIDDIVIGLPHVYLSLEEHIVEKNRIKKTTKQLLRDQVTRDFYRLLDYPHFRLIFQPLREQEVMLCRVFLLNVLKSSPPSSSLISTGRRSKLAKVIQIS